MINIINAINSNLYQSETYDCESAKSFAYFINTYHVYNTCDMLINRLHLHLQQTWSLSRISRIL